MFFHSVNFVHGFCIGHFLLHLALHCVVDCGVPLWCCFTCGWWFLLCPYIHTNIWFWGLGVAVCVLGRWGGRVTSLFGCRVADSVTRLDGGSPWDGCSGSDVVCSPCLHQLGHGEGC